MKYAYKIYFVLIFCLLLFTQNVFAYDIHVVPSKNTLTIIIDDRLEKIENIPAYVYNDNNYFMLRDIGKITGYKINWNDNSKQISAQKDNAVRNFKNLSILSKAQKVKFEKQTILIDEKEYQNIECLNIDGFCYFKLRDLSNMMDFLCDWNAETNTIIIKNKEEKRESITNENSERFSVDKRKQIQKFLDEDLNQKLIDSDDVKYIRNSNDYTSIEKYIQENIDKGFKISDFSIKESDIYDTNFGIDGVITLTMYFKVNDLELSNFGYRIICIDDTALLINFIGKKNSDFDESKIKDFILSEEEAKQKAIESDGFSYKVEEQKVTPYFDMNDMQCKYEIETVYIDEENSYFTTSHTF